MRFDLVLPANLYFSIRDTVLTIQQSQLSVIGVIIRLIVNATLCQENSFHSSWCQDDVLYFNLKGWFVIVCGKKMNPRNKGVSRSKVKVTKWQAVKGGILCLFKCLTFVLFSEHGKILEANLRMILLWLVRHNYCFKFLCHIYISLYLFGYYNVY